MGNLLIFVQKYLIARCTYFPGQIFPRCSVFSFEERLALGRHCSVAYISFSGFFGLFTFSSLSCRVRYSRHICFQFEVVSVNNVRQKVAKSTEKELHEDGG